MQEYIDTTPRESFADVDSIDYVLNPDIYINKYKVNLIVTTEEEVKKYFKSLKLLRNNIVLGIYLAQNKLCAVKYYNKQDYQALTRSDQIHLLRIKREIICLHILKHPYIYHCVGVIETENIIYIMTEYYCYDDVVAQISSIPVKKLEKSVAVKFIYQLLLALDYLHKNNITHRDIKCDNIFIDHEYNIKLADFGFATLLSKNYTNSSKVGTYRYMAPEILKGEYYRGDEIDIYSAGVTFLVMLTGEFNIDKHLLNLDLDCLELLKIMMSSVPEDRKSAEECLKCRIFYKMSMPKMIKMKNKERVEFLKQVNSLAIYASV